MELRTGRDGVVGVQTGKDTCPGSFLRHPGVGIQTRQRRILVKYFCQLISSTGGLLYRSDENDADTGMPSSNAAVMSTCRAGKGLSVSWPPPFPWCLPLVTRRVVR